MKLWRRSFALILVPLWCAVLYTFAFEATRSSPISSMDGGDWILMVSQSMATFVLVTLLLSLILLPLDAALSKWGRKCLPRASAALSIALLAITLLAVVENFTYTIFEMGLKTTTAGRIELPIVAAALALVAIFARPAFALARLLSARTLVPLVIMVFAGATTWQGLSAWISTKTDVAASDSGYRMNVLILSADGINAEWLTAYGYERETTPFMSSRIDEFVVYENAYTNNGNTTGSVTSLLTGRSPLTTKVVYPPDLLVGSDSFLTMPTILGSYGYFRANWAVPHYADAEAQNLIAAFDSNNGVLSSERIANQLPPVSPMADWLSRKTMLSLQEVGEDALGIREMENAFGQVAEESSSNLVDEARLAGILKDLEGEQPFFINSHFMDTHGPFYPLVQSFYSAGRTQTESYDADFRDDAIRDFDRKVESVMLALEAAGKIESTLVVVTSDHGKGWDATIRVPMLVRYPGQTLSGRVQVPVQRLDIAPTALTSLGIPIPNWMEGRALQQVGQLDLERIILSATVRFSVVTEEGNIHLSGPGFGSDHLLTGVVCGSFAQFTGSLDEVGTGYVSGDTSVCTPPPDVASAVYDELKRSTQ